MLFYEGPQMDSTPIQIVEENTVTRPIPAFAAHAPTEPLGPLTISRRQLEADDVAIDILYCGVCHSDLHVARNEWGKTIYPVVPGHEIIGRISKIGTAVKKFKCGDLVAVGCMVDACRVCHSCREGLEQYCEQGMVPTYGGRDPRHDMQPTQGGYSKEIVVTENFVLRAPENLDSKGLAPLLCAGITTWSPLKHWGVGPGDKVGIIGLGGLGHMGVKFAHALGAKVTMITTSPNKGQDARKLGADEVLISTDAASIKTHRGSFDFLLDTIPVSHPIDTYLSLLKRNGTLVIVGAIEPMKEGFHSGQLIAKRRRIAGSVIGGIEETQEMLDFCAQHNIVADIELIDMQSIDSAYERMQKNDVKYRFVIDMATLK